MNQVAERPLLQGYLANCRDEVIAQIRRLIPSHTGHASRLYSLMLDYPLRDAKGLRPALAISTCRALGGTMEGVLRSAAVLELYHNAFLVHDDIEDASERRRGMPTLHTTHGVPVAINVGDAMLSMTLQPLLENTEVLGLGAALEVLQAVGEMARRTVEGQAVELEWISQNLWDITDDDYVDMVIHKTGWYSFITPVIVGAIAAGVGGARRQRLGAFAEELSVAFQIQDDLLNLTGDQGVMGKELAGDLWEGKRTLPLLHTFRGLSREERQRAADVLGRPRPQSQQQRWAKVLEELVAEQACTEAVAARLHAALCDAPRCKQAEEVAWLLDRIHFHGGIPYAAQRAAVHIERASALLDEALEGLPPSQHQAFLRALVPYVATRLK